MGQRYLATRCGDHRILWLILAVLVLSACTPKPAFKGTDLSTVAWGGDFELTAHTGTRINAADFRGKILVLFFGYTHCPDICAPTLSKLSMLVRRLGDDAERVQVLFITVDPRHDTPEQLAQFVPKFHPSFIGLTGTDTEIARVTTDYKVAYSPNPQSAGSMLIDHSGGILVKDTRGKVRLLFRNDLPVADMEHDIRLLFKSG